MGYSDSGLLCKELRNADSRSGVFLNNSSLSQHLLWPLLVGGGLPPFPVCSYLCVTGNPEGVAFNRLLDAEHACSPWCTRLWEFIVY